MRLLRLLALVLAWTVLAVTGLLLGAFALAVIVLLVDWW